jgi:hypothetical protein
VAGRPGFSSPAAQHDFDTEEDRRSDLRTDCDQALIALAVVVLAYGYVRYAIAVWPQVMRIGMSNPALLAVSMAETVRNCWCCAAGVDARDDHREVAGGPLARPRLSAAPVGVRSYSA